MSKGATSSPPSSPQPLRIWAVDVSQWPALQSSKEALRPLLDDFFEPAPRAGERGGQERAATASTSKAKPSTDKEIDDSQRVLRYVREIDRTRSLAALLLPRIAILTLIQQGDIRTQSSSMPAEVSWHDLRFERTREGRPYLSYPSLDHLSLDFNISHDGDWVVMALRVDKSSTSSATKAASSDEPIGAPASGSSSSSSLSPSSLRVGIDVMSPLLPHFESSPSTFLDTMQDSVTPSEAEWVRAALNAGESDEGLERLYDLWTYKEALTKNLGLGLGFDFKRVELAFCECEPEVRGREGRRSGVEGKGVLSMDGKRAPQYVFTEVGLPAGIGNGSAEARRKGSKMVVCEGPYEVGDAGDGARAQICPSIPHTKAVERGLLRMWTMQELVDEAKTLCRRGVNEAAARGELKH